MTGTVRQERAIWQLTEAAGSYSTNLTCDFFLIHVQVYSVHTCMILLLILLSPFIVHFFLF